jgi:hypothetical protein
MVVSRGRGVAEWLLRLLVASFLSVDATVVIGIDDTIERRWGHKINARGIYRDPVRSSKGHFVKTSGLRWLSAQLLVAVSMNFGPLVLTNIGPPSGV